MGMIKCNSCSNEISPKAAACPKCGHPNPKAKNLTVRQTLGYLVFGAIALAYFAGGGLEKQAASKMQSIESQVAADTVKQYEIAKRQGDPIQACVQAGMVSAAYLQAKDESNYQTWKSIERNDCRKAGMPR